MTRAQTRALTALAKFGLPATLAVAAIVLLATTVRVSAAEQQRPTFDSLDKDKDGLITASEARANPAVAAKFAEADANQDGYLSRAEFNSIPRR